MLRKSIKEGWATVYDKDGMEGTENEKGHVDSHNFRCGTFGTHSYKSHADESQPRHKR